MGRIPSTGGGGAKFTYSRGTNPLDDDTITVGEGDTWYVTAADASHSFEAGNVVVYDGVNWHEYTVDDHSELAGVSADQHHAKPTGTNNVGVTTSTVQRGSFETGSTYNGTEYRTVDFPSRQPATRVIVDTTDNGSDGTLTDISIDVYGVTQGHIDGVSSSSYENHWEFPVNDYIDRVETSHTEGGTGNLRIIFTVDETVANMRPHNHSI